MNPLKNLTLFNSQAGAKQGYLTGVAKEKSAGKITLNSFVKNQCSFSIIL